MTKKEAQGNPAQPAGWAQGNPVNPNAHPGGELQAIEQQKRQDTAQWEDSQNRSPMDNENPAQPVGWGVDGYTNAPIPGQGADAIVAKVFIDGDEEVGGKVLLSNNGVRVLGKIVAATDDKLWVEWRDGEDSIESKTDYDLVVRTVAAVEGTDSQE